MRKSFDPSRLRRRLFRAALAVWASLLALTLLADRWIATTELPPLATATSPVVLDRQGRLLRAYTTGTGIWRLPVTVDEVDSAYVERLIAYEDRRFYSHVGVDPLAMLRAFWQLLGNGRVVSGASTLTMQVARLLEDSGTGRLSGKLRQIRLALALERRLSKAEILTIYLQRAPFGGNIEGVRAATLAYFGKEPRRLTPAEAALMIAIPQAPETRRPDRHPDAARKARDRVLDRLARAGVLDADSARAARSEDVPRARLRFPMLAPHLADRLRRERPDAGVIRTTLDRDLVAQLMPLAAAHARRLGRAVSAAIIVADYRNGEILAEIGSAGYLDDDRRGFVDMTRAVRSPGSLLKPLIYGLAFEQGLAHPATLIEDRPMRFGAWAPQNFDRRFHGTVSIAEALQRSLNLPAVAVLDAVGPARLLARLRRLGADPVLPPGRAPGLAIGLGGLGLSLEDLAALYAAIAEGTQVQPLSATLPAPPPRPALLEAGAAWQVADILAGVPPPPEAGFGRLAYKTGTSYGQRDAWAIGFDGRHVIGVWLGRADGTAVPGMFGARNAAPLLFEAFGRLKTAPEPLAPPPPHVLTVANAELPPPLRRFRPRGLPSEAPEGPEIAYPPDGARIDLGLKAGAADPLMVVKLRNGTPPFTFLVDGVPLGTGLFERRASWVPAGPGFTAISVIDAEGRAARARVYLE
ncbi:MAG: penicillin-binding protein 1C [Alphaproteobacteria bacterium]|nr:MAG: penicillin-binding protein 1C [Alphaproteobacteria bacterium]